MSRSLRTSFRPLAQRPWSTCAMVMMLAIGIGASTAVFSLMSEVLLHPMGLKHPEQVVKLVRTNEFQFKGEKIASSTDGPDAEEVRLQRKDNGAFLAVARVGETPCVVRGWGQEARRAKVGFASWDYFRVLDIQLALGRTFSEAEDQAGEPVVILSHRLWMTLLQGKRSELFSGQGATVLVNGLPFRVIGVAPRGFEGHRGSVEMWCPQGAQARTASRSYGTDGLARLKPGASLIQARAALDIIAARYKPLPSEPDWAVGKLEVEPLSLNRGKLLEGRLPSAWLLLSVSGLLLLLACANAGNLRLAELEARRQEFATRMAMGANRGALLRQVLGENLLLAILSGLLGLWMAKPMMVVLNHVGDVNVYDLPVDPVLSLDAMLMAFALVMVCALLVGLPAAIQAARANLAEVLKEGSSRITRGGRFQDALVVLQVALALLLVVCGLMVTQSLNEARKTNLGFKSDHLAALRLEFPPRVKEAQRKMQMVRTLRDRVAALPGVQGACVAGGIPMEEGNEAVMTFGKGLARIQFVGPGYFRLMGIPLLAGRDIEDTENDLKKELVSSTYAQRAWPGEDPIGKQDGKVIGVVADHAVSQALSLHEPVVFWPMAEQFLRSLCLLVRTQDRPENLFPTLRQIVREADPDMPIVRLTTLEDHLGSLHHHLRVASQLLGFCGIVSLVLAVMGVQSLMAFRVSRQAREISLRMALGAQRRTILVQVLWRGMTRVLVGLMLGSASAFALGRAFRHLLKGVEPLDTRSLVLAITVIGTASLLACLVPALRAANIAPAQALKED